MREQGARSNFPNKFACNPITVNPAGSRPLARFSRKHSKCVCRFKKKKANKSSWNWEQKQELLHFNLFSVQFYIYPLISFCWILCSEYWHILGCTIQSKQLWTLINWHDFELICHLSLPLTSLPAIVSPVHIQILLPVPPTQCEIKGFWLGTMANRNLNRMWNQNLTEARWMANASRWRLCAAATKPIFKNGLLVRKRCDLDPIPPFGVKPFQSSGNALATSPSWALNVLDFTAKWHGSVH